MSVRYFVHTGRLFVLIRHKRGVNAKHAMAANSGESWCPDRLVSRSFDISPAFRDTVASSHSEAILFWRAVEDRLSSQRNLSVAKNTRISASLLDWALDCGHCETGKDGQSEPVQGNQEARGILSQRPQLRSKPCCFLDLSLRYSLTSCHSPPFLKPLALFLRFLPCHGQRFLLIPRPHFLS